MTTFVFPLPSTFLYSHSYLYLPPTHPPFSAHLHIHPTSSPTAYTPQTNPAQPPDVDLDATYSMTFKTSNLDIRTWSITSIPLLAGTDLHTFWGDGNMRISAWLVPPPSILAEEGCKGEAAAVVSVTDAASGKAISLPKHHVDAYLKYIFNIEIVHGSNVAAEDADKAGEYEMYLSSRMPFLWVLGA